MLDVVYTHQYDVVNMHNTSTKQNLSSTLSVLISNTIVSMVYVAQSVVISYSPTYVFIIFNACIIFYLIKY